MTNLAFKGLDKNFSCRGFQYEVGKTYTEASASLCHYGFHFCKYPLDVLTYYPNIDGNRFALVRYGDNAIHGDNKSCCKTIEIVKEISFEELCQYVFDKDDSSTAGYRSHSSTAGEYSHSSTAGYHSHSSTAGYHSHSSTAGKHSHSSTAGNESHSSTAGYHSHSSTAGYRSHSSTAGYRSHSSVAGYRSHSSVAGKSSIASALGINGKAKAVKGSAIVLAEYSENFDLINVFSAMVDGKAIKENTFYTLRDGKPVEVKE